MFKLLLCFLLFFNLTTANSQIRKIFTIRDDANGLTLPEGNWRKVGNFWVSTNGDIAATSDVSKEEIQQYIESIKIQRNEKIKQDQDNKLLLSKYTDTYCENSFKSKELRPQFAEIVGKHYSVDPNAITLNRVSISKAGKVAACIAIFYTPKGPKECHWNFFGGNGRFECY